MNYLLKSPWSFTGAFVLPNVLRILCSGKYCYLS
jgi:hypothetical protein